MRARILVVAVLLRPGYACASLAAVALRTGATVGIAEVPVDICVLAAVLARTHVFGAWLAVISASLVDLPVAVIVGTVADLSLGLRGRAIAEACCCTGPLAGAFSGDLALAVLDFNIAGGGELLLYSR